MSIVLMQNVRGNKKEGVMIMARKAIKRENGSGSVYKRSDLKRRPWVAAAPAEITIDEETRKLCTKQIVIGYYETAQEAKDAIEEYRRHPTTKFNITLDELHNEWMPIWYAGKSKKLCSGYDSSWSHLAPLYDKKVREIRTAEMQAIINNLQKERNAKRYNREVTLPPMTYSGLSKIKILLGLLYKYAVQNDIVSKNYAEFIILPKKEKSSKDCFTDLELEKIKQAVGIVPYADWIYVMCSTGFRISEFLSLTPGSLRVVDGVKVLIGGIKTDAGKNRIIPISASIERIIDRQVEVNGKTLFCRPDGSPMPTKYFRDKHYRPALEQIGVRLLTPHATRRRFSTSLSAAGVREEDIVALMGHTDFSVDINHYISQSAKTLLEAIKKID